MPPPSRAVARRKPASLERTAPGRLDRGGPAGGVGQRNGDRAARLAQAQWQEEAVLLQLGRRRRRGVPAQVPRGRDQEIEQLRQLDRAQGRVGQAPPGAKRRVRPLALEIEHIVGEQQVDAHGRVTLAEAADQRRRSTPRPCTAVTRSRPAGRTAPAASARRRNRAARAHGRLEAVGRAGRGRPDRARLAVEQRQPQRRLEPGDPPAHQSLGLAQGARGGGQAAEVAGQAEGPEVEEIAGRGRFTFGHVNGSGVAGFSICNPGLPAGGIVSRSGRGYTGCGDVHEGNPHARIRWAGGAPVRDVPRPSPAAGEVLVRVHAAGVNPLDWKLREGWLADRMPLRFPLVPGWDMSGAVAEVGPGVHDLTPGDEVFGKPDLLRDGAYAEWLVARLRQRWRESRPASITCTRPRFPSPVSPPGRRSSRATPERRQSGCSRGQTILVLGGAGGVGSFAVRSHAGEGRG